jgi:hypothetical protein
LERLAIPETQINKKALDRIFEAQIRFIGAGQLLISSLVRRHGCVKKWTRTTRSTQKNADKALIFPR